MRKCSYKKKIWKHFFTIYEESVSHIWLCNRSLLNVLIYEENFIFFLAVQPILSNGVYCSRVHGLLLETKSCFRNNCELVFIFCYHAYMRNLGSLFLFWMTLSPRPHFFVSKILSPIFRLKKISATHVIKLGLHRRHINQGNTSIVNDKMYCVWY
jgi:hypothetical protein